MEKRYYHPARSDAQFFPPARRLLFMCLLICAHQVAREYPLLVAANRDEFHARPTSVSDYWAAHPELLAGKDLQQGGTWMGVTRSGRFAAVTNYRDPSQSAVAPRSRGELPLDYLTGSQDPETFLKKVATMARDYGGFNLLVGDRRHLWYFTNSDDWQPQCLPPGVYGLSNARLDTPWPKVELGKATMLALLQAGPISHSALAAVVTDRQLADQRTLSGHGLDGSMETTLSAQFIVTEAYGTRSSTTVWIDAHNQASWREQSFNKQGTLSSVQHKEFKVGAA
jgi:uncharacterized protein with NRDE domain